MAMKFEQAESFPPNSNPYCYDAFHMGVDIGSNITIMMPNHADQPCPYFYIINTETGERTLVTINEESKNRGLHLANIVNNARIINKEDQS